MNRVRTAAGLALCLAPWFCLGFAQDPTNSVETEYLAATPKDSVTDLVAKINSGRVKLTYEPKQGYLKSVLHELGISSSSQILVFSKTSLQIAYIDANTPRAIYFNDHVYVAWIRDAPNIEIIGIDPQFGAVFYTLHNQPDPRPVLKHQTYQCLQCHDTAMTGHVPGVMTRSVFAAEDGDLLAGGSSYVTTSASPIKERWGGWYVTGRNGEQRHMGNEPARTTDQAPTIDTDKGANVTDLRPYIDTSDFLTPHSDIVALMIAEQQMTIQNLITNAAYVTRKALSDAEGLRKFGFSADHVQTETTSRIQNACEPLVRALLCADEPHLMAPMSGTSRFAAEFAISSPPDKSGRRLSDLDLTTRLLKYPCSPMIYSDAFRSLPSEAKTQVLKRIHEITSGVDKTQPYNTLNPASLRTADDILSETLPSFNSQP